MEPPTTQKMTGIGSPPDEAPPKRRGGSAIPARLLSVSYFPLSLRRVGEPSILVSSAAQKNVTAPGLSRVICLGRSKSFGLFPEVASGIPKSFPEEEFL